MNGCAITFPAVPQGSHGGMIYAKRNITKRYASRLNEYAKDFHRFKSFCRLSINSSHFIRVSSDHESAANSKPLRSKISPAKALTCCRSESNIFLFPMHALLTGYRTVFAERPRTRNPHVVMQHVVYDLANIGEHLFRVRQIVGHADPPCLQPNVIACDRFKLGHVCLQQQRMAS